VDILGGASSPLNSLKVVSNKEFPTLSNSDVDNISC